MLPIDNANRAMDEAFALLPAHYDSPQARAMMLAIGLQESRFEHRWQIVRPAQPMVMGPARGFWQFEQGGGCAGVLRHAASAHHAQQLCRLYNVPATANAVWSALHREDMDGLAAGFARLLLWTDPRALPAIGQQQAAWEYYLRNWRPGKPHPHTWESNYAQAIKYA